jgi:hypothetical protein
VSDLTGDAPEQYTCELCGETYDRGRSDEEALSETAAVFGPDSLDEPLAIVCDDCWNKIHPDRN